MESQWGRNRQDTFFSPWSFLNSVTNDTLSFWGLWLEKTFCSRRFKETDTESSTADFCLLLSRWPCSFSILAAFFLSFEQRRIQSWKESEGLGQFWFLIWKRERRHKSDLPKGRKSLTQEQQIKCLAQILFSIHRSTFTFHHSAAILLDFDGFLFWLQKYKYLLVLFHDISLYF